MQLPSAYNPKEVEEKIYASWEQSGFFNPDNLSPRHKKPYTIVIPPPNVTGELHMGHALNATIQDILIRWKRMQGFKALWLPGTDHAGIATQNVVEKELRKEGVSRWDLGREKFLEKVWEWKGKYGDIILDQFKKIGCSLDWSRTKFTMDKDYAEAVKEAFNHYCKKDLIYQGERVVNWCKRCATSLSDLELEYAEEQSKLWFIKYPLVANRQSCLPAGRSQIANRQFIIVATTRPETMLGDTAVAVNPKDERYKDLIGQTVILPLANREIPIVPDKIIDMKFGTGAVKVTPAHDLTDSQLAERHNLGTIKIIDEKGRISDSAPKPYQGLGIVQAREKVVADLQGLGLLEKIEDYSHQIPKCYRCGATIEAIPSKQWFLKMEQLAELAAMPVKRGKIKFHPKSFEKSYFEWLKNAKDWCISRQIWWGHQLPVWRCQTGRMSNVKCQMSNITDGYFISLEKPEKCPVCGKCQPKQADDVLDTWFSSALWPFAALGWPNKTKDLKNFYPTDVLSTARDIINLWVARMIFSGMQFTKKIPFKNVYVHATVLTKDGKRMSKSLGTGINPIELIDKYGADAVRFGLAWQITGGQDIRFAEDNIIMGKKFCNKIWNASRFVLQQTSKSKVKSQNLTPADKKILKALEKTIKSVNKNLESFQFGKAAHILYDFFWHDFCDIYIEASKTNVNKKVLLEVLADSLKLIHPFMPFITEEIYQLLPLANKDKQKFVMIEKWPN